MRDIRDYAIGACIVVLAAIFIDKFFAPSAPTAAQEAEQRYEIVAKSPLSTAYDRCREADKVTQAWLAEKNQEKYNSWKLTRDTSCLVAPMGL